MDRSELRAEIARQGTSNRALAKDLGISEQAFYNKLNGITEFKESEIKALAKTLALSPSQVNLIFFAQ